MKEKETILHNTKRLTKKKKGNQWEEKTQSFCIYSNKTKSKKNNIEKDQIEKLKLRDHTNPKQQQRSKKDRKKTFC